MMADTNDLKDLCERVAERMRADFDTFEGHGVRVDAGEAGMVYAAIRDARGEADLGEKLADELEAWLSDELADEADNLDFAISLGSGNKDLLLQVEIRKV